ncbi:MAG: putative Zn-dependent hydrolases of the beta-lactamase fold protein [Candidatus Woesebacteria bacterium GW2011_GWB1_38_5]|uniref:Putative Zn-dependent hydrolases of the beta-lactamase fold protein n=2 Tax=Candidatus Woeseibacteriota TaxID=1752722 RepID=A0A0G0P3F8_9BACT|nr:MAG: putative Zn-dependent hydrolases of the beta-lactamase fold protein [Candidatus Woesebacteria bacterium GW2011_GWB1_38_5]KKQ83836.1 MAG: putative Zn-dependent hydrolases of the beta-lactamase fold protein [Candidatus Woesebacteria bacterium GW2011_GWA1_38_8]
MDIVYLGHSSFKLKGKKATVITDPFDPVYVGLKYPKNDADIVTVSHNHNDHNKVDLIDNVKMVINGAGEYEIMGVSIIGIETDHDASGGEERGKNIIFILEVDGLRIAHFGDLGHKLSEKLMEQMGDIDVLMIPVGGEYTIGHKQAVDIAKEFESPYVLPMHYKMPGMNEEVFGRLSGVDEFLKELGYEVERSDKLNIKKELVNHDQRKTVVLEKK